MPSGLFTGTTSFPARREGWRAGPDEEGWSLPYLECPECRLTVSAGAYFLRAHCPRCRALLEPQDERRPSPAAAVPGASSAPPSVS